MGRLGGILWSREKSSSKADIDGRDFSPAEVVCCQLKQEDRNSLDCYWIASRSTGIFLYLILKTLKHGKMCIHC